jgi:hypothetical protein
MLVTSTSKTTLIQSMLLDMYRTKGGGSCFARIYIFSPSVLVDPAWIPVRKFCETVLHQDNDKEKFLFDTFDPAELDTVITTHKKVTALGKEAEYKKLLERPDHPRRCGRRPRIARNEKQIHELYFRGRHHKLSVLISTQRYRSIAPQIRTQCTALFVFRLRSHLELEAVLEEVSATYDKKTIAVLLPRGHGGALQLPVRPPGGQEARGHVLGALRVSAATLRRSVK